MQCDVETLLSGLDNSAFVAIDTETTGLRSFHGDRPFALVIANEKESVYLPIGKYTQGTKEKAAVDGFFSAVSRVYFLQNAKFDLHMLHAYGIRFHPEAQFIDTAVLARLLKSNEASYALDAIGKRLLNHAKDDAVMAYIEEHGLWEYQTVPDLSHKIKILHFDQVPEEIMRPYALNDVALTFKLGIHLSQRLDEIDRFSQPTWPKLGRVIDLENRLIPILADMERRGMRADIPYCERALDYEKERFAKAAAAFKEATNAEYKASGKLFASVLEYCNETHPRHDTGNLVFDRKALEGLPGEAAKSVLICKDAKARINFFAGFKYHADAHGIIHTNFRQTGTRTGRFSSSDPNLQNLKRTEDDVEHIEEFPVRRAFIPDSSDHCLVMLDYKAMEYRLLLDYAGEHELIDAVKAGEDLHKTTGDMLGVNRHAGKTFNFATIYGAGKAKIADMLGITPAEAHLLKLKYFSRLPSISRFTTAVRETARTRKELFTWFGRRLHFDPGEDYAAVNHLIQGGCADIAKLAIPPVYEFLKGTKSRLALLIHDEFVLNMHSNDFHLIPKIQSAMESVYPHRLLPMAVSISHSWKSLADKTSGLPQVPR